MTIQKTQNGEELTMALEGRLDMSTAPVLEAELKPILPTIHALIMDFQNLDYISSAGLRVLFTAHKALRKKGGMRIIHVSEDVRDIFNVTGFVDFLNIE